MWRWPSLPLAEIAWRWSVGAAACSLFMLAFLEFLNTLPVNQGELLFLRSRQPVLISRAIAHILRGSLARISFAGLLVVVALTVLWILAASLGRAATLRALRAYFADRIALYAAVIETARNPVENYAFELGALRPRVPELYWSFLPLASLNFLRAAVTLGAICGLMGASILAGFASSDKDPHPGLAFLLFLPLAAWVAVFWLTLNWFLSLAAVFAVRKGDRREGNNREGNKKDALSALSAAVALCRDRFGPVIAVSGWFGLAHIAAFIGASTVGFFSLGFTGILPGRLVIAAILLITLIYFAVADWLYAARLAGYVCIAEMPDALFVPLLLPTLPPNQLMRSSPIATSIDRDETIISDVPGLAVET
jgi:hypothetical protein